MKRLLLFLIIFFSFHYSFAGITTIFQSNNKIQNPNKTISLHSIEILENCTLVTIEIIPKENLRKLNIWTSENTVISADNIELPIIGFQISNKNGEKYFSTEPFNSKWGWSNLKKGKKYYYTMAFEGAIPRGIFKFSLVDNGTNDGSHGYIFRNFTINNLPLGDYELGGVPQIVEFSPGGNKILSNNDSYSASVYSIKVFDNYTTATIKISAHKNIDFIPLYQSENTQLEAGFYSLPIQGFLGPFNQSKDTLLTSLPFDGTWQWPHIKKGDSLYYTILFDGKIHPGIENLSIIDNGTKNGKHGFSFRYLTINNPIPFSWNNFDDYVVYHYTHIMKSILHQTGFKKYFFLFLFLFVHIFIAIILYVIIRKIIILIFGLLKNRTQIARTKTPRNQNINSILRAKDKTIYIKVLHTTDDTSEYKSQKLIKKTRFLNGKYVNFYSTGQCFSRVYLHPGDYLYKIVLSFIEIKERCKSSSIKAAFAECPSLLEKLNGFINGENSDWVYTKWTDGQETICLRNMFILCELEAYKRCQNSLKSIIRDVPKIRTSLLKEKLTFAKFLRKSTKWIIRGGVKLLAAAAAGYIGASLPDFDFDIDVDVPDFDGGDFEIPDFDIDTDSDFSSDNLSFDEDINLSDSYNVSFGSQNASLSRSGGGLGNLSVSIDKEPGSANLFCIKDSSGKVLAHNVSGTTSKIKIDGIWYLLPKLKG